MAAYNCTSIISCVLIYVPGWNELNLELFSVLDGMHRYGGIINDSYSLFTRPDASIHRCFYLLISRMGGRTFRLAHRYMQTYLVGLCALSSHHQSWALRLPLIDIFEAEMVALLRLIINKLASYITKQIVCSIHLEG